jgi:predicted ATP-grasp superfamily ATP-dependent carboligase
MANAVTLPTDRRHTTTPPGGSAHRRNTDSVEIVPHLQWNESIPPLRRPALILAFEGWNDAGEAASTAAEHLVDLFEAETIGVIEAEEFYDFSTTRPLVMLDNGVRSIEWPSPRFAAARLPDAACDLVVLSGIEPHLRWRSFAAAVVEAARSLEVSMVVSLGALIADVAHSRPTTVFGSTYDPALGERLNLEPSSYEGPTGIVGVLTTELHQAGFQTVSLWGSIPSYVPHASSPKAALALIDRLGPLLGFPILGGDLVEAAADYESQIDSLVSEDTDTQSYVASLEAAYDASMRPESSAALIEELENFLRDQ